VYTGIPCCVHWHIYTKKNFTFKIGMLLLYLICETNMLIFVYCRVACKYNLCGQYGMLYYKSVIRELLVSFEDYINSVVFYSVPSVVICIIMVIVLYFTITKHRSCNICNPRNNGLGCWKSVFQIFKCYM
jgi:hypothetical protein